jgi:plastocyanin/ketosteroid isomerase-like protein
MWRSIACVGLAGLMMVGCAADAAQQTAAAPQAGDIDSDSAEEQVRRIQKVLDDWHQAAADADEEAYFSHFTADGVFLGTDATERWDVKAFRKYAHPHFAKGKAWSFKAARRDVILSRDGLTAWFDEDLDTPNLGPSRGSGVLLKQQGVWKLAHYNLTITVPNDHFKSVKQLLDAARAAEGVEVATGHIAGVVTILKEPKPPARNEPAPNQPAQGDNPCKSAKPAIVTKAGLLADVLVRVQDGAVRGHWQPGKPVTLELGTCSFRPPTLGLMAGQKLSVLNKHASDHHIHAHRGYTSLLDVKLANGAPAHETSFAKPGMYELGSAKHAAMNGHVVVSDHPFFSVSGEDGSFTIKDVPIGKYVFEAWHAVFGWKRTAVTVVTDKTAQVTIEYTGDEN